MSDRVKFSELGIGDQVMAKGYDEPVTIFSAKRLQRGPNAGHFECELIVNGEGELQVARFGPDEQVQVIAKGKNSEPIHKPVEPKASKAKGGKRKAAASNVDGPIPGFGAIPPAPKGSPASKGPKAPKEKKPRTPKAPKAKDKKLSQIDAAYQILSASKEPMGCAALVEEMGKRGLWSSANGKTPAATLYSAILRDIGKGAAARFKKTDRGLFVAK